MPPAGATQIRARFCIGQSTPTISFLLNTQLTNNSTFNLPSPSIFPMRSEHVLTFYFSLVYPLFDEYVGAFDDNGSIGETYNIWIPVEGENNYELDVECLG